MEHCYHWNYLLILGMIPSPYVNIANYELDHAPNNYHVQTLKGSRDVF
jgi:hypothetical protein